MSEPAEIFSVHVCAAIRQGSAYAADFFRRLREIDKAGYRVIGITVTLDGAAVTDPALLQAAAADTRVLFIPEGAAIATVETMSERSVGWARAANLALEASLERPADRTLWVEADLDFDADLISRLLAAGGDIVAPRVHCEGRFYDTWGFRTKDGARIRFDKQLLSLPRDGGLIDLASVGSCLLFPTEILRRGVRLPGAYPDGLLVGFCHAAAKLGFRVSCAHGVIIRHPAEAWAHQLSPLESVTIVDAAGESLGTRPGDGLRAAGAYAEFIAPLLRKHLCRHSLAAKLWCYRRATFRFATLAKGGIAVRVRLSGETSPAAGFSRCYAVYPQGIGTELAALMQRVLLSWLKRFGRAPCS
jgi:hypothetical protein